MVYHKKVGTFHTWQVPQELEESQFGQFYGLKEVKGSVVPNVEMNSLKPDKNYGLES